MRTLGVLVRIEALKAVKRPALWVTLGVFAAFNAVAIPASARGARASFPDAWREIIEPAGNMGPLFLAALAILLFAPEFRWRTARQNVIDGLSKEQFYWGKVLLLPPLAAAFFAIPAVVGVVDVALRTAEPGGAFVEATDLNYMLGYVAALLLWGSAALTISALVRAAGGGLGVLFLYFICEQIAVGAIGSRWIAAERILGFLPAALFQTLVDARLHYPLLLAQTNVVRAERGQDPLVYPEAWVVLAAAGAYVILFLALAYANMRRRDL